MWGLYLPFARKLLKQLKSSVTDIFDKDCQVLKELWKLTMLSENVFHRLLLKDVVEIPAEKPDIEEIIKVECISGRKRSKSN